MVNPALNAHEHAAFGFKRQSEIAVGPQREIKHEMCASVSQTFDGND